jgi:branched-subunit amino acid transport protein AzlD
MQILLAVFCLGIAFYAWRSWSRNPLYSPQATLKIAGVTLLGVALAVVLVLLIASCLPSNSFAVTPIGIMALISAITLGMVAASVRITDGPIASVAAGTKLENTNRRKLTPWLLGAGLALLLLLGWAALVSSANAEALVSIASVVLAVCAAALGSLYMKARRTDYASTALKADYWVHWQDSSREDEMWLGPEGLLIGDAFTPWLTSGNYLTNARVETVPNVLLQLTFEKAYGASNIPRTTRVPVPVGRESDLEMLEEKLRARCPKARIDL